MYVAIADNPIEIPDNVPIHGEKYIMFSTYKGRPRRAVAMFRTKSEIAAYTPPKQYVIYPIVACLRSKIAP